MSRWSERDDVPRGEDYDARWESLAASGDSIHGEADLVSHLLATDGRHPGTVLDAGCGTGRVAIELAARGVDLVGVDLDAAMLATAARKAPTLTWVEADLVTVALDRTFDVVVMAGNVMIFVAPGTEGAVVANLARHVAPGGLLVAGFQLGPGRLTLEAYDTHAATAGLVLEARWSTWDRAEFAEGGDYAVSCHRRT